MTVADTIEDIDEPTGPRIGRLLLGGLLSIVLLFCAGIATGAGVALIEGAKNPPKAIAMIAAALFAAVASGVVIHRMRLFKPDEPISDRTRQARKMLFASMLLGLVIGISLSIGSIFVSGGDSLAFFDDAPMPPAIAIGVSALYAVMLPIISWRWWRNIDEHEARAYGDGAIIAISAYSVIAPGWWLLARGGIAPEPHSMIIFLVVFTIWGIAWMVRRFR